MDNSLILDVIRKINSLPIDKQKAYVNSLKREGVDVSTLLTIRKAAYAAGEEIPLSFAQQRLWFLSKLEEGTHYNMSLALRLSGKLNERSLTKSLEAIVDRHEALRTRFVERGGIAYQVVDESADFEVGEAVEVGEEELKEICELESQTKFDLSSDRLIRVRLLKLSEGEHVLLVTMHHSVSDGWSMGIFFRELWEFYRYFSAGQEPTLPSLPIQYADFSYWQRQWLTEEVLQGQLDYWREQLRDLPSFLELPTDYPRPSVKTYNGAHERLHFSTDLLRGLKRLSDEQGGTLYMTLLSAFSILLSRYSGQTDIAVGSPIANRNRSEIESLIGFFVNTLVMRTDVSGDPRFVDLLLQVKETSLESYAHQDIPFEQLVEELNPERSLSHSPLFQVMFTLQNQPRHIMTLSELSVSPIVADYNMAKFDLTLNMQETPTGLQGNVEYNTDLFDVTTIQRFICHYERLLEGIVQNPELHISEYEILSELERNQQLIEWNDTERDYPREKCIHELFEEQATLHPDKLALVFKDEELSYEELNFRSNQVAHYLISRGVKPDTLVGLCVERSLEMVIGLLGILKAGGAYVPIDPSYPEDRIGYMFEDSGVEIVLSQLHLSSKLPLVDQTVVYLDVDSDGEDNEGIFSKESMENIPKETLGLKSAHLAYVIYTSGSTGRPKGVMVEHRNVIRLVCNTNIVSLDILTATLLHSSISFDAATFEVWSPLLNGGKLVVYGGQSSNPHELATIVKKYEVNTLWLTSGLFSLWVEQLSLEFSLKYLIVGGDVVSTEDVRSVWCKSRQLFNAYGPTEITVCVAAGRISGEKVSIGKPLDNTTIYIIGRGHELLPIGAIGELYVGGAGVARGYLNNDELTRERFIQNPFSDDPNDRLYKTGDLGRWLPDGNIEFIGRADDQVKIRGFRVEPGEVESQLSKHSLVRSCVVIAREEIPGDKRLVAYVLLDAGVESDDLDLAGELRGYLQTKLPEYMIPSAYVELANIPLTVNGKVDRKALPAPDVGAYTQDQYVAPKDETERVLVEIWSELLGLEAEAISTTSNFFALRRAFITCDPDNEQLISQLKSPRLEYTDVRSVV